MLQHPVHDASKNLAYEKRSDGASAEIWLMQSKHEISHVQVCSPPLHQSLRRISTAMSSSTATPSSSTATSSSATILETLQLSASMTQSIKQHARTSEQVQHISDLWLNLTVLLETPVDDVDRRIGLAFGLLKRVIVGLERLGPITEEYIRKAFNYGEQALKSLAAMIEYWHGGREVDFAGMVRSPLQKSKSLKDKRQSRRVLIERELNEMSAIKRYDARRLDVGYVVLCACASHVPMVINYEDRSRVKLPGVAPGDELWEEEMFRCSAYALMGVAQCLGFRFMRSAVEIKGQVVPGTGLEGNGGVLEDWEAVEDESG